MTGAPVALTLSGAQPPAPATLVLGLSEIDAPFKGGVLVPAPDLLFPIGTNAALGAPWPPGVPSGFALRAQWWIVDAGGPLGLSASNGVRGTTP